MRKSGLTVKGLSVQVASGHKPVLAVDAVSFDVDPGETLALVGESGSGKTMLALAILRLLPPRASVRSGQLFIGDKDVLGLQGEQLRALRGRQIAYISQETQNALNPVMTIGDQIKEVFANSGVPRRDRHARTLHSLEEVGLSEAGRRMKAYPHQLSGGMKQRVAIAMALAGKPDILIADEPTTALDVTIQAQILTLLSELQSKSGLGIVFITHDLAVVQQIADRVAVMHRGKFVECERVETLMKQPSHPYTRALLSAAKISKKEDTKAVKCPPAEENYKPEGLLVVKSLTVTFKLKHHLFSRKPQKALGIRDVNFSLKKGSTLAIVGESGCGKSTLAKAIVGLVPVESGQVFYRENLIPGHQTFRKDVQLIFQNSYASLNPRMTIEKIVSEGIVAQGLASRLASKTRVSTLLRQVGLSDEIARRYPAQLSGGQRQRVCIARALAVDPKLLICDEPTSALDVSIQAQILKLLTTLQIKLNLSLIVITHNFSVVSQLADEIIVMHRGNVVERGDSAKLLNGPQHPYTRMLLASIPDINAYGSQ